MAGDALVNAGTAQAPTTTDAAMTRWTLPFIHSGASSSIAGSDHARASQMRHASSSAVHSASATSNGSQRRGSVTCANSGVYRKASGA
jgi:hypothetical protein